MNNENNENNLFNILNHNIFNNNNENTNRGVSEEFKNNLDGNIVDEEFIKNDKQCSICLEDFKLNDKYIKLPCSGEPHFFHSGDENCSGIKPWLERNNTCPMCRTEFPQNEQNIGYLENILNNHNVVFETVTFHIQRPNIDNIEEENREEDQNREEENQNIVNINPNNLINRMDNIIRDYVNEIQETNEQRDLQMAIEASLNDT